MTNVEEIARQTSETLMMQRLIGKITMLADNQLESIFVFVDPFAQYDSENFDACALTRYLENRNFTAEEASATQDAFMTAVEQLGFPAENFSLADALTHASQVRKGDAVAERHAAKAPVHYAGTILSVLLYDDTERRIDRISNDAELDRVYPVVEELTKEERTWSDRVIAKEIEVRNSNERTWQSIAFVHPLEPGERVVLEDFLMAHRFDNLDIDIIRSWFLQALSNPNSPVTTQTLTAERVLAQAMTYRQPDVRKRLHPAGAIYPRRSAQTGDIIQLVQD